MIVRQQAPQRPPALERRLRAAGALLLLPLLLPLSVPVARAKEGPDRPAATPTALEPVLEKIREAHGLPALAGLVLVHDRVVAEGATGWRKQGGKARVTAQDKWHLGSCTKAMTATVLGRLHEQGILSLDTHLEVALPDLREAMHPAWREVPIHLLLAHRAGVPSDLRSGGLWARLWKREGTPTEQRQQLVSAVLSRAPMNTPGEAYAYANGGYAIAGYAAERATGRRWEALMRELLFEPLGMSGAGFGAPGSAEQLDQPWGHHPTQRGPRPVVPGPLADNPPAIGPAGTVHAPLRAWARFVGLHLVGAQPEPEGLLLEGATLRRLQVPAAGADYALGWLVTDRDWARGSVLTHTGSNTSWFAVTWIAPRRDFAVLVACNQGGDVAAKACDQAAWALIRWQLDR